MIRRYIMKPTIYLVVALALLSFAGAVFATEYSTKTKIALNENTTIDDDYYVYCTNLNANGTITGDLIAFGMNIDVAGEIGSSAILFGNSVDISGDIKGSLRAFAEEMIVSGDVENNAEVAGTEVTFARDSSIGKDVHAFGQKISINGNVGRDVNIYANTAEINGTVDGNVRVTGNEISIGPDAVIKGRLIYTSDKEPDVSPTAQIVKGTESVAKNVDKNTMLYTVLIGVVSFLALFLVGFISIAIMPRTTKRIAESIGATPMISFAIGISAFIGTMFLLVFLAITFVGLPLALIIFALYLILIYMGTIYAGVALGMLIFKLTGNNEVSTYLYLLTGLLALTLLGMIPFAGPFIKFAAMLSGFGGFLYYIGMLVHRLRKEQRI